MINFNLPSINPFAIKPPLADRQEIRLKKDIQVDVGTNWGLPADLFRNIINLPEKLLLWNASLGSGNVSEEVIEDAKQYLHFNGLHDVYLSVNQYKPAEIWKRIFTNPNTSTLSKLSMGVLSGLLYQFLPPRLLGGDMYDPASNTVHLFSNDSSIALHECGHAKDLNSRENPTLYTLLLRVPYVKTLHSLYTEYKATANAIQYTRSQGMTEATKNAFKVLIPAYMSYVSEVLPVPPTNWPIFMAHAETNCGKISEFFYDSSKWDTMKDCYLQEFKNSGSLLTDTWNAYKPYFFGLACLFAAGHVIGRILAAKERPNSLKEERILPDSASRIPVRV